MKIVFTLENSADYDAAFYLGFHCLPVLVEWLPVYKGLIFIFRHVPAIIPGPLKK